MQSQEESSLLITPSDKIHPNTLNYLTKESFLSDNDISSKIQLTIRRTSNENEMTSSFRASPSTPLVPKTTKSDLRGFQSSIYDNAVFLILLASLLFAIMNLEVKVLGTSTEVLPTFQLIFIRSLFVLLFSSLNCWYKEISILGPLEIRKFLILRGIWGFGGLTTSWYAVQLLSLSDATVLSFIAPIFTGILGRLVLKENYEWMDVLSGLVSLSGVVLVARPKVIFGNSSPLELESGDSRSDSMERNLGVGLALISALFASSAFVTIRYIGKRAKPQQLINYFSFVCIFLSLSSLLPFFALKPWILPSHPKTYLGLILLSTAAYVGQVFLSRALQLEKAGKISTLNYTQVLFAFLLEWIVLGASPNTWSILGSVIIGLSVMTVSWMKLNQTKISPIHHLEENYKV